MVSSITIKLAEDGSIADVWRTVRESDPSSVHHTEPISREDRQVILAAAVWADSHV